MSLLIKGPIEIGQVNLDIHSMLFGGLFMIIGMQAICFAFFAKRIADYHLKKNNSFPRILKNISMEHGLIVGVILLLLGGTGSCYTLLYWIKQSFGPLIPTEIMRILIPSITLLILGMQLILPGFFIFININIGDQLD